MSHYRIASAGYVTDQGYFVIHGLALATISICTHYEDTKGDTK